MRKVATKVAVSIPDDLYRAVCGGTARSAARASGQGLAQIPR